LAVGILLGALCAAAGQAPPAKPRPRATPASAELSKPAPKRPAPPKEWIPTRTPWGDPDLQGVWNDATSTPLQRPSSRAGKDVLSDEEANEFQQELAFDLTRDRRDGGPEADVNRAYNDHWMDARRLKITADRRSTAGRTSVRTCANGWATRAAASTATRSSLKRPTSGPTMAWCFRGPIPRPTKSPSA